MNTPCEIEGSGPYAQVLARSVCAIVFREAVVREKTTYRLLLDQDRLPIHGTGFLVAPNIVATSQHVVGSLANAYTLVFDFVRRAGNAPECIGADHVRDELQFDSRAVPGYVLLRFDEPIIDRRPLALSRRLVAQDDLVFAIGHPAGTTMKFYPPKRVVESDPGRPVFKVRDVGTTCGNSGSPLFEPYGYQVVGAVDASITATQGVAGWNSLVTAIRTTRLAAAVQAHDPGAYRVGLVHT